MRDAVDSEDDGRLFIAGGRVDRPDITVGAMLVGKKLSLNAGGPVPTGNNVCVNNDYICLQEICTTPSGLNRERDEVLYVEVEPLSARKAGISPAGRPPSCYLMEIRAWLELRRNFSVSLWVLIRGRVCCPQAGDEERRCGKKLRSRGANELLQYDIVRCHRVGQVPAAAVVKCWTSGAISFSLLEW